MSGGNGFVKKKPAIRSLWEPEVHKKESPRERGGFPAQQLLRAYGVTVAVSVAPA
jgi:hypothetical protein